MASTVTDPRLHMPLRTAKVTDLRSEARVQQLKREAGEALDIARAAARLEPKAMAAEMGISHSLVLRAMKGQGDLGFHRLWQLSDTFWLELIIAIAKKRGIAIVRTTIDIPHQSRTA